MTGTPAAARRALFPTYTRAAAGRRATRRASTKAEAQPWPHGSIVEMHDADVFRSHPSSESERPLFPKLSFALESSPDTRQRWAVISKESNGVRTRFLHALQGQFVSIPPTARSWPFLGSSAFLEKHGGVAGEPSRAVRYVGFANAGAGAGSSGTQGAYLSARYESRRETTDWSLRDYLRGTVSLNLSDSELAWAGALEGDELFERVVADLNLRDLLDLPVGNLSNGQTRRSRIAKALLQDPEVLLLDEPFAGLDPSNYAILSAMLKRLADRSSPRVVLALQETEPIPDWVTRLIRFDGDGQTVSQGAAEEVLPGSGKPAPLRRPGAYPWDTYDASDTKAADSPSEPLVEMDGVKVTYGDRCVLGDWSQEVDGEKKEGLHWTIRQGERWGVFGANGSGKTTVISLLTSDHPQAYSLPIKIFGRSRLPTASERGISVFDIQNRIGHSSPEVHTYFPKTFSIRRVIESAWAEAFHSRPFLTYERDLHVDAALRWFRSELDPQADQKLALDRVFGGDAGVRNRLLRAFRAEKNVGHRSRGPPSLLRLWLEAEPDWADNIRFSESSLSAQKVALFIRAVIKKPDIVVLDEAFSGMDEVTRKKCMLWLAHGEEILLDSSDQGHISSSYKRDSALKVLGVVRNTGLEPRQAVVCVSHREEEVPFVIDKWMHLPEPNEGKPVRFGEIERSPKARGWWKKIWTA